MIKKYIVNVIPSGGRRCPYPNMFNWYIFDSYIVSIISIDRTAQKRPSWHFNRSFVTPYHFCGSEQFFFFDSSFLLCSAPRFFCTIIWHIHSAPPAKHKSIIEISQENSPHYLFGPREVFVGFSFNFYKLVFKTKSPVSRELVCIWTYAFIHIQHMQWGEN